MAQRFRLEIGGKVEFDRTFIRIKENIADLSPEWEAAFEAFQTIEAQQFDTEGKAGATGKWKELSPDYASWKELYYPGAKILERTGRLVESLTATTSDTVKNIGKLSAEFGTRVEYARNHQDGIGVPKREVISFSEKQKRFLQKEIQKSLVQRLDRTSGR
jgi:phage gpG-like protein